MPELAKKCIASWHKFLPDYEIKEWNEDNFDLSLFPYVQEAYEAKKYAFVTDVVRLYALYKEGGIYMDTDVEVTKPLDKFLSDTAFSGFESNCNVPTGIMGSEKGGKWVKSNLDYYINRHFRKFFYLYDYTTNVVFITNDLVAKGLKQDNTYQNFPDYVTMYPNDYFCPMNWATREIKLTENTCTIHHFAGSWTKSKSKELIISKVLRKLKIIGKYQKLEINH
jgi:mannosyltransferase OCH1-like enzyme